MAHFGGANFTTFNGVNLKNTAAIRLAGDNGTESTLSVRPSLDAARAWHLPDKSGTFPITGTFTVNLPAISAATQVYSTVSTVAGIRTEDGVTATLQNAFDNTARILVAVVPGNGQLTTYWYNLGVAANSDDYTISYTAVR